MNEMMFENITNEDLMEVEGGSITLGTAHLIVAGATMLVSAGGSAFNGYQEAKRENEK